MLSIFNTILNTLIRNVPYGLRIVISLLLFLLAILSIIWAIKPKDDKHPIAWGWLVLCFISMGMSIVYIAL